MSIARQHIRKYLHELLILISELWSTFSFPAAGRPQLGYPVCLVFSFGLHLPGTDSMRLIFCASICIV